MFMDITSIDLFDQNASKAYAEVRLRCTCTDMTDIGLFNQSASKSCAEARFRCTLISLVLVYFSNNIIDLNHIRLRPLETLTYSIFEV